MPQTTDEAARAQPAEARAADAFSPAALAGDLAALRAALAQHLRSIPPHLWGRPTERAAGAWTLHQALAHVTAVAEMFLAGVEAGMEGRPFSCALTRRQDLHAWNAREIERLVVRDPDDLRTALLDLLERSERIAAAASPQDLLRRVDVRAYNRPMTLAQLLGSQIAHAGIIHAPQLTGVAGAPPLWAAWDPRRMHRNLTRLVELLSLAYWPERGGAMDAVINYRIGGPGGGAWHVHVAPDGGRAGSSAHPKPALSLWFRTPDVFCRIITQRLGTVAAALTGRTFARGDLKLALTMGRYFLP